MFQSKSIPLQKQLPHATAAGLFAHSPRIAMPCEHTFRLRHVFCGMRNRQIRAMGTKHCHRDIHHMKIGKLQKP